MALFLFLGLIPFILGLALPVYGEKNLYICIPKAYLSGVMESLALFTLLAIPMTLREISFSFLCRSYLRLLTGVLIISVIAIVLKWIREFPFSRRRNNFSLTFENNKEKIFFIILCLAAAGAIGFQMWRMIVMQEIEYKDSDSYVTLINDTIQSDTIHMTYVKTGQPLESVLSMSSKFLITSWQQYQAFLCYMEDIHPAIFYYTLFPPVMLFWHYSAIWLLGVWFFKEKKEAWPLMLIFAAFINEATRLTVVDSFILLDWTVWGKGFGGSVGMIFLLYLLFSSEDKENRRRHWVLILFTAAATSAASPAAAITAGVAIAACFITACIRRRFFTGLVNFFAGGISPTLLFYVYCRLMGIV